MGSEGPFLKGLVDQPPSRLAGRYLSSSEDKMVGKEVKQP